MAYSYEARLVVVPGLVPVVDHRQVVPLQPVRLQEVGHTGGRVVVPLQEVDRIRVVVPQVLGMPG